MPSTCNTSGQMLCSCFYGYNESFAGPDGADAYRAELVKLVQRYSELRREKGKDVRFVLFSPIAYQNTGDRNLPDGTELNTNLAAFTEATREAAAETGATFVDLFSPTIQLFESSSERYTINGIHLNANGYQKLAEIISQSVARQERTGRRKACRPLRSGQRQELALAQSLSRNRWQRHLGRPIDADLCRRPKQCRRPQARTGDAGRDDSQSRQSDLGGCRGQEICCRRQQCPTARQGDLERGRRQQELER